MQTMDMTPGDLLYRLTRGRDPPWNSDMAKGAVPRRVYRRPSNMVEWLRSCNPLVLLFCGCGRLREAAISYGYMHRVFYPRRKPHEVQYAGLCDECGELMKLGIDNGHAWPPRPQGAAR